MVRDVRLRSRVTASPASALARAVSSQSISSSIALPRRRVLTLSRARLSRARPSPLARPRPSSRIPIHPSPTLYHFTLIPPPLQGITPQRTLKRTPDRIALFLFARVDVFPRARVERSIAHVIAFVRAIARERIECAREIASAAQSCAKLRDAAAARECANERANDREESEHGELGMPEEHGGWGGDIRRFDREWIRDHGDA